MTKEMFMIEELVKEMALILINEKGMSMMYVIQGCLFDKGN